MDISVQQKEGGDIPIIFTNNHNFPTFNSKILPYINIEKLKGITTNIF